MAKRTGLGKGLDALIPAGESKSGGAGGGVTQILAQAFSRPCQKEIFNFFTKHRHFKISISNKH
mgnify:CR=1 FL=1